MLKKVLATILSFIIIISMVSAMSAIVTATPYKEFKIGEGETIIESVFFDGGVDNYYESDPETGSHDIRPEEEVQTHDYDLQGGFIGGRAESGLSCIGWTSAEEWVQYTVQCEITGVYDLSAWCGTDPGGDIVFYCNDNEIGSAYVENNGEGWQDYALYYIGPFHMTEGTNVIKTEFPEGNVNFESFVVTLKEAGGEPPPPVWKPKNFKVGAEKTVITAVDFDAGANNYGKSGNPDDGAKGVRGAEDVNTETGTETSVSTYSEYTGNVGWIGAGDWVQYTVQIEQDGKYSFAAWLASAAGEGATGNIEVYVDDQLVGASENAKNVDWQSYDLYSVGETEITSGRHIIKTVFPLGAVNFAALEVTRTGDMTPTETEAPPADEAPADDGATNENEEPADGGAETTGSAVSSDDEGNNNTVIFILVGAAVVVVLVIIIVVVTRKKK